MFLRYTPLVFTAGLIAACGGPDDWPEGRPRIDQLRFVQQSPQDPYALEFLLRFTDADGDTGTGMLHMSVQDEENAVLDLTEVFDGQSPPLPLDASSGEFEVVVRVSKNVEIGDELKIGFFIEDAAGEKSNDPWIELRALAAGSEGT